MLLSNDVLDKVGQNWVSLNTPTGKRRYFSGSCTTWKVIISSFAGIGYCGSKTSNRFFAAASMARCGVGMDFPTKETSVGSWLGSTGGMCTAAQYSEVEGVILDLNSSY